MATATRAVSSVGDMEDLEGEDKQASKMLKPVSPEGGHVSELRGVQ